MHLPVYYPHLARDGLNLCIFFPLLSKSLLPCRLGQSGRGGLSSWSFFHPILSTSRLTWGSKLLISSPLSSGACWVEKDILRDAAEHGDAFIDCLCHPEVVEACLRCLLECLQRRLGELSHIYIEHFFIIASNSPVTESACIYSSSLSLQMMSSLRVSSAFLKFPACLYSLTECMRNYKLLRSWLRPRSNPSTTGRCRLLHFPSLPWTSCPPAFNFDSW